MSEIDTMRPTENPGESRTSSRLWPERCLAKVQIEWDEAQSESESGRLNQKEAGIELELGVDWMLLPAFSSGKQASKQPDWSFGRASLATCLEPMIGENRQLATDEPVELEK